MIGKTLGHYRTVEKFGAGGMGVVHKAEDRLGPERRVPCGKEAILCVAPRSLKALLRLAPVILTCVYGAASAVAQGLTQRPPVTPKPALQTLLPAAGRLCEGAFSSREARVPEQLSRGTVAAGSVLSLKKVLYEQGGWTAMGAKGGLPFLEGQSAEEVQALVCIEESRVGVGTYTSRAPAYRIDWDVRLVSWPDGLVLAGTGLYGGDPPFSIDPTFQGQGYGSTPFGLLIRWTLDGLDDKTILLSAGFVLSVVFGPDGKTLASGSRDQTVKLWDVAMGKEIRTLSGHTSWVNSVTFAPDGKTLASGSVDQTVKLWDVAMGKEIRTLSEHTSGVNSVTFAPDGKTLASGSRDQTVKLWDVATGKETRTLSGHTAWVNSLAFAPDGKTLASGSHDETVKLWNVATGKQIRTLSGHSAVYSVAFAPDGKTLAAGNYGGTVKLWNVATGKQIRTLSGHTQLVYSVAFAPDGKTLASGSADNTVKVWDMATGKQIRTLSGHTDSVSSVAFAPDGKTLAAGSWDALIKLWDLTIWKK